MLKRFLGIMDTKLGPEDEQVAYRLHQLGACVRKVGLGGGRAEEALPKN